MYGTTNIMCCHYLSESYFAVVFFKFPSPLNSDIPIRMWGVLHSRIDNDMVSFAVSINVLLTHLQEVMCSRLDNTPGVHLHIHIYLKIFLFIQFIFYILYIFLADLLVIMVYNVYCISFLFHEKISIHINVYCNIKCSY